MKRDYQSTVLVIVISIVMVAAPRPCYADLGDQLFKLLANDGAAEQRHPFEFIPETMRFGTIHGQALSLPNHKRVGPRPDLLTDPLRISCIVRKITLLAQHKYLDDR